MTPFEERFHQMKAEIEALKIRQDETDHIMIKKQEMQKLAGEFDDSPKNTELRNRIQEEHIVACIDYLRASNDVVRKISEKMGNQFEDEINKFEKEFSEWSAPNEELIKKFYESSKKLAESLSHTDDLSVEEMNSVTKEARKNIENIQGANKQSKQISNNLVKLASKIENIIKGFDSLIDFLDGNRH